jgi:hypothetical protein
MVWVFDENARREMASHNSLMDPGGKKEEGTASQRQWKKEGWVKKTPRTGYFGEENWEGGGPPYKPIYINPSLSAGFEPANLETKNKHATITPPRTTCDLHA